MGAGTGLRPGRDPPTAAAARATPARGTAPATAGADHEPRSGDGKVEDFGLAAKARALGAKVILLEPDVDHDVAALAREAVADGADLLGVAGGDGTQAQVAAVAAESGLPFLVVPAGTRNHFAMDLGLDRADPSRSLDALTDGVEVRVDLGRVAGRPFVNTVSFGVYAEIVQSPEYRDAKNRTILQQLPERLLGASGARLEAQADDIRLTAPQAVLVSNNPYTFADPSAAAAAPAGPGRPRRPGHPRRGRRPGRGDRGAGPAGAQHHLGDGASGRGRGRPAGDPGRRRRRGAHPPHPRQLLAPPARAPRPRPAPPPRRRGHLRPRRLAAHHPAGAGPGVTSRKKIPRTMSRTRERLRPRYEGGHNGSHEHRGEPRWPSTCCSSTTAAPRPR
ncbi:diacylglycerol/lipid kinase family protein [Streptacidiphilus monticola]